MNQQEQEVFRCDSCGDSVTREESGYCERHDAVICNDCTQEHMRLHRGRR